MELLSCWYLQLQMYMLIQFICTTTFTIHIRLYFAIRESAVINIIPNTTTEQVQLLTYVQYLNCTLYIMPYEPSCESAKT